MQGGMAIPIGMWALLVLGFISLGLACLQGYVKREGKRFILLTLVGMGFWGGAICLSGLEGGWWWVVPWGLAAVSTFLAARRLREYYWEQRTGNWGLVLAALCLVLALVGPAWSLQRIAFAPPSPEVTATQLAEAQGTPPTTPATATPAPVTPSPTPVTPGPSAGPTWGGTFRDGGAALLEFLLATFRSVWGIFHYLVLLMLGYLWLGRRWSGVPLVALLIAVGLCGAYQPETARWLTHVISSSPATWMQDMLRASMEHWGTMGWGILLTAVAASLLLLPALRIGSKVGHVQTLYPFPRLRGSLEMSQVVEDLRWLGVRPLDYILAISVMMIVSLGLLIGLWSGLRQIAEAGGSFLGFAGIPDLTVPHWGPVWHLSYFLLAFLFLVALNLSIWLQKKWEPLLQAYPIRTGFFVLLPAIALISILCPAGVMLLGLGSTLTQTALSPLRVRGISEKIEMLKIKKAEELLRKEAERLRREEELRKKEAERRRQEEELRKKEAERRRREEELRKAEEEREKGLVWSSPSPLVAMLEFGHSKWFLAEKGVLFVRIDTIEQINLPIRTGMAIFALKDKTADKEGEVLVIGDGQKILRIGQESRDTLHTFTLSQTADAFVLNPYKTMLAWMNSSAGVIGGLFLETGREVTFTSGLEVTPAMAFSPDGRYLAIGAPDGRIYLFDIAARQIRESLRLPETSVSFGQAVRYLAGRKEGGWLAVYKNKCAVLWGSDNQVKGELAAPRRRLNAIAFHPETGRLAFGLSEGNVQVFDANLNRISEKQVEESELTWIGFSTDGQALFTIGNKTVVRKVQLL